MALGKCSMPLEDFQLLVAQARNEANNPSHRVRNLPIPAILTEERLANQEVGESRAGLFSSVSQNQTFLEIEMRDAGGLPMTDADMCLSDESRTDDGVTRAMVTLCDWRMQNGWGAQHGWK